MLRSSVRFSLTLSALKSDSIAGKNLYAVFRLHNLPYLVTKGDKVILPFKMKNVNVGDKLNLTDVITLGSPHYTYTQKEGISEQLFKLTANVTEVTREPYYEVIKTRPRCRRKKIVPVQPFQTVLTIDTLKLA